MTDHTLDPSLLDSHFHDAASWLSSTPAAASLPTETKLEIYGLYKVATIGFQPNVPAPGFFSLPAAKAKHSAWQTIGERYHDLAKKDNQAVGDAEALSLGQSRAKERYIDIARGVGWTEPNESTEGSGDKKSSGMGMKVSVMRPTEDTADQSGTDEILPIHDAASAGDLESLKRELSRDPKSLNAQALMGLTPLHLAADRGHVEVVRYLLEIGADSTLKDVEGLTPYDMALDLQREDVLKLLREATD